MGYPSFVTGSCNDLYPHSYNNYNLLFFLGIGLLVVINYNIPLNSMNTISILDSYHIT